MEDKGGRPEREPTDEEITTLTYWVRENLTLSNAARHAGVHPYILNRWMEYGSDDVKQNLVTIYSQLFKKVCKSQADKITELLNKIETCPKNFGALVWILEKCFKEEFSSDAEEYKYLVEKYLKLQDDYESLKKRKSLQGVAKDGGKVDSSSN